MSRNTTETIKVTPETKALVDELNKEGETLSGTIKTGMNVLEREKGRAERAPMYTYGELSNRPVIEVDELIAKDGAVHAVIDPCPLCKERHTHGIGDLMTTMMNKNEGVPSHKNGHCRDGSVPNSYYILITSSTKNKKLAES